MNKTDLYIEERIPYYEFKQLFVYNLLSEYLIQNFKEEIDFCFYPYDIYDIKKIEQILKKYNFDQYNLNKTIESGFIIFYFYYNNFLIKIMCNNTILLKLFNLSLLEDKKNKKDFYKNYVNKKNPDIISSIKTINEIKEKEIIGRINQSLFKLQEINYKFD